MTNPFLFLDKPQDTTPNPFAFLDKPKQEDPGVFSYLGNITKNSLAILSDPLATATNPMAAPITGLANLMFGNSPQDRMQLQQIRKNLYDARQTESDTYKLVKEDLRPKNFFSKIKDLSMGSPSDIISGLPQAIASTIGSPISALTGLQMGQEGAPISTPEQRAADVKSTAGIALSTLVGGVTSLALKGAMEKAAFGGVTAKVAGATLGEETNMGLNILAKGPKIGQLGRDLLKGGVEAAAAGATFGAVANANKEGQLGSIITGLMFAPIGMAGEMLGTKIKGGDDISKVQQSAGQLFLLRQLQYSPDKSLFELTKNLESIATSDDLAMAVAKGKMEAGAAHIIIPNVSADASVSAIKEGSVNGGYYKTHRHLNEDGTFSVLFSNDARVKGIGPDNVYGSDLKSTDYGVFEKTGYVPNEVVSYKGKDYLFNGEVPWQQHLEITSKLPFMEIMKFTDSKPLSLKDPVSGQTITAPINEISRNTAFNLDNGKVMIDSPLTLKGKLLAVNRDRSTNWLKNNQGNYVGSAGDMINPYANENNAALSSVKTGSPIAFIGMRQSRGQQIIGNGKFYALTPEHLLGYTPSAYEGYSPEVIKGGASPFKLGTTTTAPGRETIPGIKDNNLSVNRLTFENPFVFNGKHYSLTKDIEQFYNQFTKNGISPNIPEKLVTKKMIKSSEKELDFAYHKLQAGQMNQLDYTNLAKQHDALVESFDNQITPAGHAVQYDWSKILTPQEMKGIIEARALEQKPIGLGTKRHLEGVAFQKLEQQYVDLTPDEISNPNPEQKQIVDSYMAALSTSDAKYPVAGKTHSESHYAIIDRIMSKALRRNGHDGFIYNSGGIHNAEVVDLTERGSFNRADQTVPVEGKASNILDPTKFVDKLYDEFKPQIGTDQPFDEVFDRFTKMKGMLPEETANLRRSFEQRIHGEILDALPPEEKPLFKRFQQEIATKEQSVIDNGTESLRTSALVNNMYFDDKGAGVITLRDGTSNKELGTFHSIQDANEFIKKSGQTLGTNLDGNATIPPSASAPPKIPDNTGPMKTPPRGWLDRKYALWSSRLQWATPNASLFKSWDTQFKTNFHETVFHPVEQAARIASAKESFWQEKIQAAEKIMGKKVPEADYEHVFNWMETRSIAEHEQFGGVGNKPLSPMEMTLGKHLVPADLGNIGRFQNAMRSVKENTPEGIKQMQALRDQFKIGLNEDNAMTLMSIAERNQVQKLSIGASIHYARLLQNPELALTRAEYAKKFNLKPSQLQAGAALDNIFSQLADVAGMPKDKLLFNYITHARLYENGNLEAALNRYAIAKPTQEFYAALNRTGELQDFERNPFKAAWRYNAALHDVLYLNPVIEKAQAALKDEMKKLPDAGLANKVERDATRYLNDVRGIPAEGDKYADAAVNHFSKTLLNGKLSTEATKKWSSRIVVNETNKVFVSAAQAGRVWAGIRDFWSNNSKVYHKWGMGYSLDVLEHGAKVDLKELQRTGKIEVYNNFGLGGPAEEGISRLRSAGGNLKSGFDKSAELGMKLSGQQMVNDMARGGGFSATRSKVAEMTRNLFAKKFGDDLTAPETYQKAYHTLQLERYSAPVQQTFDKMIKNNKFEEAAEYLGSEFIQETWGNYANANHPSGWNNNFGRLVGKFGQWSINHRDYVVSLASRGTRTQRLASLGRLAMTESAIAGAATLLGVNLSNFYSLPGMYFKGGPAGDLFYTAYNAMFGRGMEQESAIRKITQLLPYDQVNDKIKGSIVVPFSFALTDLVDGLEMASNGDVAGGLARIGGVRPMGDNYQPSQWEQTIGDIVGGR